MPGLQAVAQGQPPDTLSTGAGCRAPGQEPEDEGPQGEGPVSGYPCAFGCCGGCCCGAEAVQAEQGEKAGSAGWQSTGGRCLEEIIVLQLLTHLSQPAIMVLEMPAAEAMISRDRLVFYPLWKTVVLGSKASEIRASPLSDDYAPGLGSAVAARAEPQQAAADGSAQVPVHPAAGGLVWVARCPAPQAAAPCSGQALPTPSPAVSSPPSLACSQQDSCLCRGCMQALARGVLSVLYDALYSLVRGMTAKK